ncbi:MAG: T9SS type A sorting domain-containing protein [Bacteroidetes bacterium]|nr:T9SS type A sorting domain-containing protein [Bacteroidota bacterium]
MKKVLLFISLITSFALSTYAQTVYVNENFNGAALPVGWSNNAVTGTHVWEFGLDGSVDHAGNNNIDGTAMAYFDDSKHLGSSTNDFAELVTPAFNNAGALVTNLEFDFNFRQYGPANDSLIVEVFDGTSWHLVYSVVVDNCGNYLGACVSGFPHASINIGAYANAACKVRFRYFDGNDWGWYAALDNIKISSPLANDLQVSRLTSPFSGCGLTNSETITAVIKNIGSLPATNFNVAYTLNNGTPVSENISATIAGGDSLVYTFTTNANLSTVGVYNIRAYTIYAADGNHSNDTALRIVENEQLYTTPYFQDFEASNGGWTVSGTNASWQHGTPNNGIINSAYSGQKAFVTNLTGPYNNSELSYLTSPCYNFSTLIGDPILNFAFIHQTEAPYDRFWMESSIDNGLTWTKVLAAGNPTNWYNSTATKTWQGVKNTWVAVENILTGLAGQSQVKLRFVFSSDGSTNLEGVGIDNISLREPQANDLSLRNLVFPSAAGQPLCGFGIENIIVEVENKGANPIVNPVIGFRVDNGAAVTETFTTTIAPNTTKLFTFTTPYNFSAIKNYNVDVWGTAANDVFNVNDSILSQTVVNTLSTIKLTPFNEDFDGFTVGTTFSNTNDAISGGWTRNSNNSNSYTWRVGEGTQNRSSSTGPDADHTSGTGYFMYTEASSGSTGDVATLESPCLDLGAVQGANLIFWYHRYGTQMGSLFVDIYDGVSWTNAVSTISAKPQTGGTSPYTQVNISLSAYAGKRIKVRFRAISQGCCAGDMAIDDVIVYEPLPQDAELLNLNAPGNACGLSTTTPVSIKVGNFGTSPISANSVQVNFQIDNRPVVSETLAVALPLGGNANHNFVGTADLSIPNRTYKVKTWTSLAGDSNYGNDTLIEFVTNQTKTLSFSDNFDSFTDGSCSGTATGDVYTGGWYVTSSTGYGWQVQSGTCSGGSGSSTSSLNTGPAGDHTTGNGMYVYTEASNSGGPAELILPCINLTNVNGAILNFWYHKYGSQMGNLFVDVQNGSGNWINNINFIPGETHTSPTDPWKERTVSLGQFVGQEISIRFRAIRGNGFEGDMAIDDILIYEPLPQDAKMDSLISPESGCDLTPNELICVVVENFGTQSITSLTVGYSVNGSAPVFESKSAISILPGAPFTYCMNLNRVNMSAPGRYNFKIWADLPGDSNKNNDTLFQTVINETILFPSCEDYSNLTNNIGDAGEDLLGGKFSNNWFTNQGAFSWEYTSNVSPGPTNDHTPTGPTRYMTVNPTNGDPGNIAIYTSPCFDLTTVAVANLEFWYHVYGGSAQNNTMYIDLFDGNLWQNRIDSIKGQPQQNSSSPWKLKRISLANYTGNFVNVRFRAYRTGATYSLDDICMVPPPPNQAQMERILRPIQEQCFYSTAETIRVRMKNLGSNNIDSLQVRIKIDTSNIGGANSGLLIDSTVWAYPGATPPAWAPGKLYTYNVPIPVNMSYYKEYNITAELILNGDLDLVDNKITDYKVIHRAPIQFPHIDGFETIPCNAAGPIYNNGFKRENKTYQWRIKCGMDRAGSTGPAKDHTRGNNQGRYFVTNSAVGKAGEVAILETPCFDMSQLNKPSLRYWYHMFGADMGELYVDINADKGWVPVDTIFGEQQINNASPWKKASIDLQAFAGQYAKFRFRSVRGDGTASNMAIDDLFLYDLSKYDVGPTELVLPGDNNFSCYSDTQSVHVKLLNYGANALDFTFDSVLVTVDILKNGVQHATMFRNINTNIFFNLVGGTKTPFPSDSSLVVWVNNSASGSSTFDMSDVGATYTFNVHTSSPRDSVSNNDDLSKNITTQIAGGNVVVDNNSICNGTIVKLTASNFFGAPKWERKYYGPGGTSYWLPEFGFGSDAANYTVQPDTTAMYRVRICGSDVVSDSVLVNVTVVKIPDPIHDTICGGGPMTVEAYAAPVYNLKAVNWYHNETDDTPFKVTTNAPFTHTDNFSVTDTFWLEGVIDSCTSLGRSAVYAVVNPYPIVELGAIKDTLCQDTNRVLNAGAGFGYDYLWRMWGPNGYKDSSKLQTIGINPLKLEKDSTYKYKVTVTSNFGCVTISPEINVTISDSCFVGIEEPILAKQFELYPNPTNERVNIKFSGNSVINADIQIQSMEGKRVWSKRNLAISNSNYEIDLTGLSEGIYLVKIRTEDEIIVKKLIKN